MIEPITKNVLPHDLSTCESILLNSLYKFIDIESENRISVNLFFEGLKLPPLIIRLSQSLGQKDLTSVITFSDIGSAALAKRDFPQFNDRIFTYKELLSKNLDLDDKIILAVSPQPYDYELFEELCSQLSQQIIMINGRLEETSIGVGYVGRERRINFIRSWRRVFWIQPLTKGAIFKAYPGDWQIFKYTPKGYKFCSSVNNKPDVDTINKLLD